MRVKLTWKRYFSAMEGN